MQPVDIAFNFLQPTTFLCAEVVTRTANNNNNNNNNKLYLHDYNKVLQYCKRHLKIYLLISYLIKITKEITTISYFLTIQRGIHGN